VTGKATTNPAGLLINEKEERSGMRRIAVVVTARPSYSRVKTVLEAIASNSDLDLHIVTAASANIDRYGDITKVIQRDGFEVTAKVMSLVEGENPEAMAKTTGLSVLELSSLFSNLKPDMVLTVADRYETIATAIASTYLNIPLAHLQGGEVTGNIDEKVRHAITKLADFHFVANEDARTRVLKMGEVPETVFNTGCPSIDLAVRSLHTPELDLAAALNLYGGVGVQLDPEAGYLIVLQHPVTSEYMDAQEQLKKTIQAVDAYGLQALFFWPNPDAGSDLTSKAIRTFRESKPDNKIHFFKNIEPVNFLQLLLKAKCIIGNSSVAVRECAFLGVPAVNIGTRQALRQRGKNILDVPYDTDQIKAAIKVQVAKAGMLEQDTIYGDGTAGVQIAKLCAELTLKSSKYICY